MWHSGTVRIGNVAGIAIDVHFTFILVVSWGAFQGWTQYHSLAGTLYGIAAISLLFGCVLLHEIAHGLQARRVGLAVRRVILLPIGGLAQLEAPPSRPRHELAIALAGPLANLGLAVLAGVLLMLIDPASLQRRELVALVVSPEPGNVLAYLLSANALLFTINMLPAFPMDGGRVLRAGLALIIPYVHATRIAAWIGRLLAGLIVLRGIIGLASLNDLSSNLQLILIGTVIFTGAQNEEVYVRRQWALARVEVGQIYQKTIETVSPWDTLTRVLVTRLFKYERILPVLVDQRIVGLLGYEEARRSMNRERSVTVAHVMRTNFPTLGLRDTLWVALQVMTTVQLTMLPVVEGNAFQGVISLDDIDQAWRLVSGH